VEIQIKQVLQTTKGTQYICAIEIKETRITWLSRIGGLFVCPVFVYIILKLSTQLAITSFNNYY
jgi:hypothetical protein